MIKVLVCGYGSIGQKHTANLKKLGADIKIWRSRASESAAIEKDGYVFEPSLEAGLQWCDAAIIATATDQHITPALKAAKARKPYYLEKPLSHNMDGVSDLLAASHGVVVEVGCQLRQHQNLKALKKRLANGEDGKILAFQAWVGQRLDTWRPNTDYRESYSAHSKHGGGALFDLVHEIDLIHWLIGPVKDVYADLRHNSRLEMEAEDLANLILSCENGACGNLQLDMLSPTPRRGLQIICENALYTHDLIKNTLTRAETNKAEENLSVIHDDYTPANMLKDCLKNFITRVQNPALPAACSLEDAIHDLEILCAAKASSKSQSKEKVAA